MTNELSAALEIVRGAVSTKDLLPVLTHLHIYAGRIQGANGRLNIDTPCGMLARIEATVPADRFIKAVEMCNGTPSLKVTETKLVLSRGSFRAQLPLADHSSFPRAEVLPTGWKALEGGLLSVLRILRPFISTDAIRPWACTALLQADYGWATNNVSIIRTPLPRAWSGVLMLPVFLIDELLRIDIEPEAWLQDVNHIMFRLPGGTWIRSQKFVGEWPDNAFGLIKEVENSISADKLYAAVEAILPFCPDKNFPIIHTGPKGVSTTEGETYAEVNDIVLPEAAFNAAALAQVLQLAKEIDLTHYPKPCPFKGDNLEGVLVGCRT